MKKNNIPSWKELLGRVNTIIQSTNQNYKDEIKQVLGLVDKKIRGEYTIDTILKYIVKIMDTDMYNELYDILKKKKKVDYGELDVEFRRVTGRGYLYFLERYEQYINKKYIQHLFNKWKAPRFIIQPGTMATKAATTVTTTSYTKIEDEKLQKIQQMINKGMSKVLNQDKDTLRDILTRKYHEMNPMPLFEFGEKNMYKYIINNNLRPRPNDRDTLLRATVWIYLKNQKYKLDVGEFIDNPRKLAYAKNMYNKLSPTYFMTEISYDELLDTIRDLLPDNSDGVIDAIRDKLEKDKPKYKRDKINIIYNILKPLGITKKKINEVMG